jgi:hypothetical protein
VARILGTALLWAAFDNEAKKMIPLGLLQQIHEAFDANRILLQGTVEQNENPVLRITLEVYESEGLLMVSDIDGEEGEQGGGTLEQGGNTPQRRRNEEDRRVEVSWLRRELHEAKLTMASMKSQQDGMRIETNQNFKIVFRQLNRIESQPGRRTRVAADDGAPADLDRPAEHNARLGRCPKTLHLLWDEWTNGLNGNLAARRFTTRERGRVKHVYSKRKIFWDKVGELVRSGELASVAIDKIYYVYGGGESVTTILKKMQADKQIGGHLLLIL